MLTLGVNDLLVFNNDGIESSESRSLSESLQFDIVKLFSVAALSGPDTSKLNIETVANSLLPSVADDLAIKDNIATIISRVLVNHMEYFKFAFEDVVEWHINHAFYGEMSTKSTVVSNI